MVGYLLLLLALGAGIVVLVGPAWDQIAPAFTKARQGDTSAFTALAQEMRGLNLLTSPIQLVVMVVFTCAIYRAVLMPEKSAYGFLRLGGRELWVGLLRIIYGVMTFGVALAIGFGLGILFVTVALASGGARMQPGVVGLILLIAIPVVLILAIWLSTRLSLAQPMTFAASRLQLFDSWSLTRGRFWRILGAYILAWIMAMVISLIAVVIVGAIGMMVFAPFLPQLMAGTLDWSAQTPRVLGACILGLWVLVGSILGPITHVLVAAPGAYIYRALRNTPEASAAFGDAPPVNRPPGVLVL